MSFALLLFAIFAPQTPDEPQRVPGLTVRHFQLEGEFDRLFELAPDQTPNHDAVVGVLALSTEDFKGVVAPHRTEVTGWIELQAGGEFTFRLVSDDGARLFVDGRQVVDADGLHGAVPFTGEPVPLEAGLHALRVEHFDNGGASSLRLEWQPPGASGFSLVPAERLSTEADPTRVTSPGVKAVVDDRRPGLGLPVDGVHPAYRVEDFELGELQLKVGALAILPDGRIVIGTFDPLQRDEEKLPDIESKAPDGLFAVDPESGDVQQVATDLFEPAGACVVDGDLYVAHRRAITRLTDRDGDGFFETHSKVGEGWEGWNYHQFTFGLVHREGRLYAGLSTTMAPPAWEGMETNAGPNGPLRGGILEVDLATEDARVIAGGTRTPNGIGTLSDGSLVYLDNQGAWMPASVFAEVIPGRFFGHHNWTTFVPKLAERFPEGGHPSVFCDRPRTPPTLWLPQNEVVNSPTQPIVWNFRPGGGPRPGQQVLDSQNAEIVGTTWAYPGEQVLIGELTAGGLRRACLERVDGVLQGALFRFSQGIEAGVNRVVQAPDGSLVVGCIGAQGNWNWRGTQEGLQRLVPTGVVPFEMARVKLVRTGFLVRFTKPVDVAWLEDLENYRVQSWSYEPTQAYGGPKTQVRDLGVLAAIPMDRGREVLLRIEGLAEGTCVHLQLDPVSIEGEPIWSGEAWYTINRLTPTRSSGIELGSSTSFLPPAGAVSLVHGERLALMGFEGAGAPANAVAADFVDAAPSLAVGGAAGELVSTVSLGPGRLHLEWRAPRWLPQPLVHHGDELLELVAANDGEWRRADLELSGAGPLRLGVTEGAPEATVPFRNVWFEPRREGTGSPGDWERPLEGDAAWHVRGGTAAFTLEDGVLVGTTVPGSPNSFYTSEERYGDFELLYEFRVDGELNSGVQIRSEVAGGFDNRSGGLIGYQVEIDPSARAWTAGLYEERGRGWLHPLHAAPYARRAFRPGAWNRVRVLAEGQRIRTWLNGVPAADLADSVRATGHLGFQVHGVGDREDPLSVSWRNVRIRRLGR